MSRHQFDDDSTCRLCGARIDDAEDTVGCDVELQNPDSYAGFALTQAEQAQLDGQPTMEAVRSKERRIRGDDEPSDLSELVRRRREFEVGGTDEN